jgi:hypothetical protein
MIRPGNMEIWNSLAPKKYKISTWLALHNRLTTRDRLAFIIAIVCKKPKSV